MNVLNTASKLYYGATAVDRAYVGTHVVWQPAATGAWGPNEGIYASGATPAGLGSDPQTFSVGNRIQILADGRITGIRHWRDAVSSVTSHSVDLWTDAGVLLMHGVTTGDVAGWNTFAITPINVSAGDVIRVTHGQYGSTAGDTWPYNASAHTSVSPNLVWHQGVYAVGPVDGFPSTATDGYNYFVDIVYQQKLAAPAGPTTHLCTSFTPGTDRNDYTGEVGVRLGIGAADVPFQWIGIRCAGGSTTPRRVYVYEWFSNTPISQADIDFTGKAVGDWVWVKVAPATMLANGYYALALKVTAGDGQTWSNPGPTTFEPVFANIYSIYRDTITAPGFANGTIDTQFVGLDLGW